ncbi:MAG: hypothetical protein RLY31_2968 [Bacteroidota bacterium]|jgi:ribosomal-protein-serine acetyltransferase
MELKPFIRIDEQTGLHLARPELTEPVFELVESQRAYLRKWLPWVDVTLAVEDTRAYIRTAMAQNKEGSALNTFLVHGRELAGALSVVHFNRENRKCELGYWLREDLQGQGMMTQACRAFLAYLFRGRQWNRVELYVAVENTRSLAVAERLGFVREGTLRQAMYLHGRYCDVTIWALLRDEWVKQNK